MPHRISWAGGVNGPSGSVLNADLTPRGAVGPTVPARALYLSLAALLVAGVANVLLPAPMEQFSAYLWLLAIVPIFLFAYYRGWEGATAGLAAAMLVLVGEQIGLPLLLSNHPDWWMTSATAGVFLVVSLGLGWTTEMMHRRTFNALQLAFADPLTGLGNRRVLEYVFDRHMAGASRGIPVSVVMFDLDDFKGYNDAHGHAAGDAALVSFARVLEQEARRSDLPVRTGGEEFVVVLSGASEQGALAYAERVQARIRSERSSTGETVTVSAGIAEARAEHRVMTDVIAAADKALYQAKRDGRDRIRVAGRPERQPAKAA